MKEKLRCGRTWIKRDLNKPFGIAFYPPGNDPQILYVAGEFNVCSARAYARLQSGDMSPHAKAV
jgi:hypothetical protein